MTGRISRRRFNDHFRHKPLQTIGGYHRGYPVRRKAVARHRLPQTQNARRYKTVLGMSLKSRAALSNASKTA
jgi:hypothetical protein